MSKGVHHGGSDSKTSAQYFGVRCSQEEYRRHHHAAFCETMATLCRLRDTTRVGERPAVEFIYTRDDEERHVVAFRFRSDEAYDKHYCEVIAVGSGLARGVWEPFRDDWTFREWLAD